MKKIDKEFDEFKAKILRLILDDTDVNIMNMATTIQEKNIIISGLIDEIYINLAYSNTGYCGTSHEANGCSECKANALRVLEEEDALYLLDDEGEIDCKVITVLFYYEPRRKERYEHYGIADLYDIQDAFLIYDDLNGNR